MVEHAEMLHKLVLEDICQVYRIIDCFRELRNSCADSEDVQRQLGRHDTVLGDTKEIINRMSEPTEDWIRCLQIASQFLGNLIVNHPQNQNIVWSCCSLELKKMIQFGDTKLTDINLMVLYNILLGSPDLAEQILSDLDLVKLVCHYGSQGLEYGQYVVENMLTHNVNWTKIYTSSMPEDERLFLLEVFDSQLKQSPDSVPVSLVLHLADEFCLRSTCILRTVADKVETLQPVEVAKLLQILASSSAQPPHTTPLQGHKNLFINCAFLLKSIHMAGKEKNNCFSVVPKLSAADDEMQYHPTFGFKANLIRVLGNLCWKHKDNQDLMKDLDIIPLLLDCSNMDARNPYIVQWVVLAVRNLCEGNRENKSVIANMKRQGLVESAVLTEMGLTLHSDGDNMEIGIIPLSTSSTR